MKRRCKFGGTAGLWLSRVRYKKAGATTIHKRTVLEHTAPVNMSATSELMHNKSERSPCSPCPTSTPSEPSSASSISVFRSSSATGSQQHTQAEKRVDSLYLHRKKTTATRKVFGVCKRKLVPDSDEVESRKERRVSESTWSASDDDDEQESSSLGSLQQTTADPAERGVDNGKADGLEFPTSSDESMKSASSSEDLHPMLQNAREYFEDLDRTSLEIEPKGDDSKRTPGKHFKIRTRRCKLARNKAKQEYRRYCDYCNESNIEALPMDSFLEQRAGYFRRHEVFDGMFDE